MPPLSIPGKRLVMLFGVPNGGDFLALRKTFNPQTFFIFYAAAETNSVRGESFLERFSFVHNFYNKTLAANKHERHEKKQSKEYAVS
jgi:hypothetical protein